MSFFRELAFSVRATNRASSVLSQVQMDTSSLTASVRTMGTVMTGLGSASMAVFRLGGAFGLLNTQQERMLSGAAMLVTVVGIMMRTDLGAAIAKHVYTAACMVADAVEQQLILHTATFLALTGVGIAVIVAAAAAMLYFASTMNQATASVQSFNSESAATPTAAKGIIRSTKDALYRQGIESP